MKPLTWVGWFNSSASFPIVNAAMVEALWRRGATVLPNQHNHDGGLTPWCLAFEYPPRSLNIRHSFNMCMSVWEFQGGARAVPETFKRVFDNFDLILTPSSWTAAQYRQATDTPVEVVRWGVDINHFTPDGPCVEWASLFPGETWTQDAQQVVLGVGGTDYRHGWDVALKVIDALPETVHMVAKMSVHYPINQHTPMHPRVHVLKADINDMAPLYRAADLFLMTARGVGFSLPVTEALACGLPVASTPLPPILEYANDHVVFGRGGQWVPMGTHHVHDDCVADWLEPDVDAMIEAAVTALAAGKGRDADWAQAWSWDAAADWWLTRLPQWSERYG